MAELQLRPPIASLKAEQYATGGIPNTPDSRNPNNLPRSCVRCSHHSEFERLALACSLVPRIDVV